MPLLRGAHDPRGDRFELLHVGDAAAAVLLDDDRHAHRILSPRWLYNPDFCIQRRSLMTVRQLVRSLALLAALLAPALVPTISAQQSGNQVALRTPDVIFVPTPEEVVDVMLKVAKTDVVYDLGSGDGRIPITAARQYGARAVGIDIDPVRIGEANANLKMAAATDPGLLNRVRFLNNYLFLMNISEATVVTLYLLPSLNIKLIPKLNKELKPGTRVVSHAFDMGPDIKPDIDPINVNGRTVYYYTIPID